MNVWKPWFVSNPRQIGRRLARLLRPPAGDRFVVRLPWGVDLAVNPRETIGTAIWTTGIYDLAVSEVLYRLLPAGGSALDVGANVGYMTSLLAAKAGPRGRVEAFEPHPAVGARLRDNVARLPSGRAAPVTVHALALSDRAGTATLTLPPEFAANEGVGSLAGGVGVGVEVPTATLDGLFPVGRFNVMKLDVEGHEPAVLAGGAGLLGEKNVRHIVFEEHHGPAAAAGRLLANAGYTLFQIGWRMGGPVLAPPDAPPICKPYEAPSFLATVDPAGAAAACAAAGWQIYRHPS